MTFNGVCFEFDVRSAAHAHAQLMLDNHGHTGSMIHSNMSQYKAALFDKVRQVLTLTNWDTLRFVIGTNKSGIC